jgi:DNA repair protein RadC
VAEKLLARHDGLPGLAQATIQELCQDKGVGEAKAIQVKAALELGRRLLVAAPHERPQIRQPADAANLLMAEMSLLAQEHLRTVLLDSRNRVISIPTIYVGSLNAASVRVGEVFREAIRASSAAMIVVHNHPSGDPTPSPEDVQVTRQIVEAGSLLNIDVLDHLIIGRQRFVSMKERGLGFR